MNRRIEKKLVLKKSNMKSILEISYQLKRISKKQKLYLMKDYHIKK